MNQQMKDKCDLFAQNYDLVKKSFAWEYSLLHFICAYIYTAEGKQADTDRINACKNVIKANQGIFSTFRNALTTVFACKLSICDAPEEKFAQVIKAYDALKTHFMPTSYLAVAAFILADGADEMHFEAYAKKTREVYDLMKQSHPLLTGWEDVPFAVLTALSSLSAESLARSQEACYGMLKSRFWHSNATQAASHVLALCGSDATANCRKTVELYDALKAAGYRCGYDQELVGLSLLVSGAGEADPQVIIETSDYLKGKRGFGNFLMGKSARMLYSTALLLQGSGDASVAAATQALMLTSAITTIAQSSAAN